MKKGKKPKKATDPFEELREIILKDDRKEFTDRNQALLDKIDALERELNDPERFAEIIQKSKAEIIDVLGPQMGKMIAKYVRSTIEGIFEGLRERRRSLFSFGRSREKELRRELQKVIDGQLAAVFMIDKRSGLLIGEYSQEDVLEPDMIASMLTAIKSFVEDAFGEEDTDLESLELGSHKLSLFNLKRFYIALVIDGILTFEMKEVYNDKCLQLADYTGAMSLKNIDDELKNKVNQAIENIFFDEGDQ